MLTFGPAPETLPCTHTDLREWLPDDPFGVRLVATGHHFDAVKVPDPLARAVVAALGGHETSFIEDLSEGSCLWLVTPGSIDAPTAARNGYAVLSVGWHIGVPGRQGTTRRQWNGPHPRLTQPCLLQQAIERATQP